MIINVADDANVELDERDDVDSTTDGDTIAFSVEGEILDVPSDVLNEFAENRLTPVDITFELVFYISQLLYKGFSITLYTHD